MLRRWRLWRLSKLEERRLVLKEYYMRYTEGTLLLDATMELILLEAKISTLRRKIDDR